MRITLTNFRATALAPLTLVLAACGDDAEPVAEGASDVDAEATGEVLGGEISDEMLPFEQLRSQSPAVPRATSSASGSSGPTASDDINDNESDSGDASSDGEEADAPSQAPTPEPEPADESEE